MSTLVPDTSTDRHAIARGLVEVDSLDYEAGLWRELADFLAEPLALHNLLSQARREILAGIFDQPEPAPEPAPVLEVVPEPEPESEHWSREVAATREFFRREAGAGLADVAPRRGGKYQRRNGWLQGLRAGWRDEIGAPA